MVIGHHEDERELPASPGLSEKCEMDFITFLVSSARYEARPDKGMVVEGVNCLLRRDATKSFVTIFI